MLGKVMTSIQQQLADIVGTNQLITAPEQIAPFCLDWRRRYQGNALAVAMPSSVEQTAAVVRFCMKHRIAIVPQGGNTSTCGGATPDSAGHSLIIALRNMRRIELPDTIGNSITTQAGATLAEIQQAARQADRLFPLTLASEGSCQIGGNLSTDAGGMAVLRYGTMRDLTLGVEAVLPSGEIYHGLSALHKDTSGLDLKHLFIGAEGTLGIITAATLKLCPLPRARATALIGLSHAGDAVHWLSDLKQTFDERLTTYEIMSQRCLELVSAYQPTLNIPFSAPWVLLIELSDSEDEAGMQKKLLDWLSAQDVLDGVMAKSESERHTLWRIRELVSDAQKHHGPNIKHDIAVPISALAAFMDECYQTLKSYYPDLQTVVFGHIGDGSLHYNISSTRSGDASPLIDEKHVNQIVYDLVYAYGGTLAAEHGIGQLKTEWLKRYQDPVSIRLMKQIKACLDPLGLMNPGKKY